MLIVNSMKRSNGQTIDGLLHIKSRYERRDSYHRLAVGSPLLS
jgi:hypothetical protein